MDLSTAHYMTLAISGIFVSTMSGIFLIWLKSGLSKLDKNRTDITDIGTMMARHTAVVEYNSKILERIEARIDKTEDRLERLEEKVDKIWIQQK